jgi:hypothetical protein
MLNLNRANLSIEPINGAINDAIERAAATAAELPRPYLGASIIGYECARRIQYDWWCKPELAARTRAIFDRGHYFEERTRGYLIAAGFKFAPSETLAFSAIGGALRGHADGIIIQGPDLAGAYLICPAIWEHKALNAHGWRDVERDGLGKRHAHYLAQISVYQAYLNITNPALCTVTNADSCERLHFFVPSTPSVHSCGATAPSTSSRQRVPASCSRVPMTSQRIGTAGSVRIRSAVGDEKRAPQRRADYDPLSRI